MIFLLNGKTVQIISGEMHPARVPEIYWPPHSNDKGHGIAIPLPHIFFWNYHETKPGVFDFKTGNKNIASFIRICQQEGMWVLCAPPLCIAPMGFGGLPTYLLKTPDIKLRCMDSRYMAAVKNYVSHLAKEKHRCNGINGGPILMVQVENEYGSYGNDKEYIKVLQQLWKQNGIKVPFYTCGRRYIYA